MSVDFELLATKLRENGCEGAPKGCKYDMIWAEVEQMALDNGLSFR